MNNKGRLLCTGALLPTAILCLCPASAADQPPPEITLNDVRVESIADDRMSIDVASSPSAVTEHLLVRDTGLQARLKGLQKGDHLSVVVTGKDDQDILLMLAIKTVSVTRGHRAWVLFCSAVLFLLFCVFLSGFHPLGLIISEDGRYSNSKFQMALWFGVAIITYVATVWLRTRQLGTDFLGNVSIPQNLLLLSGMSVLTFGAAKGITTNKVQSAIAAGNPDPKHSTNVAHFWSDLTHSDTNQLDLGDFQMLVITFLAVASYLALAFHFLRSLEMRTTVSLPDVDTTILAAFGLGHGAYLTKKAVGNVGQT